MLISIYLSLNVVILSLLAIHYCNGQGQCTLARDEQTCNELSSDCHWCSKNEFCAPRSMSCPTLNATTTTTLFGLTLFSNGPATMQLNSLDISTGNSTALGPAHKEIFGTGDLAAISTHGIYYYLGDTSAGATLVGLNLTTGTKVCSKNVPLNEIKFVGLGQSLDYDAIDDTLILSGINENNTGHIMFSSKASSCGPFTKVEAFADSEYMPMLHSSTLDAKGKRLFVLVGTGDNSAGVGIIDLTGKKQMTVIDEGGPSPDDTIVSMHWDSVSKSIVGVVASSTGLELHSLNPSLKKWNVPLPIKGVPSEWNALLGNAATVSSFDVVGRLLYFVTGIQDSAGDLTSRFLAKVNVDSGKLVGSPKLSPIGLGGSGYQSLNIVGV